MYTFDIFCYGHDFSKDSKVSTLFADIMCSDSFYYNQQSDKIVRKLDNPPEILYEVYFPYHGGQTSTCSICFGVCIATSEANSDYTREVRSAKKKDYSEVYEKFVAAFKRYLNEIYSEFASAEEIKPIIEFLDSNKPCFYSVEASS